MRRLLTYDKNVRVVVIALLPLYLTIALIAPTTIQAQEYDLRFTHLTLEDGLSSSVIDAVLQDQRGFLWFGTQEGLNRFDGTTLRKFKHNPRDPSSLSDNWVHTVVEDRDGMLWIGTRNGLNRFDPTTSTFTRFFHDPNNPNSLNNNIVPCLYIDPTGALWICTGSGLNRFDPDTNIFTYYALGGDLTQQTTVSIYADGPDQLWIGFLGGGLVHFQPSNGLFSRFRNDPEDPDSLSNNNVWAMLRDAAGRVWVGTDNGLNRLDESTGRFTHFFHDPTLNTSLPGKSVFSLHIDQYDRFWVGTNNGAAIFDPAHEIFSSIRNDPTDPSSFSGKEVDTIYESRDGLLWFGTRSNGVELLDPWNNTFEIYRRRPDTPQGMPSDKVDVIAVDRADTVWIGSRLGLSAFDRRSGSFTHYPKTPDLPGAIQSDVTAILQDRAGDLWVGTYNHGIARFDPATGTFQAYHHSNDKIVTTLYEDRAGNLWIGVSAGLLRLDPARNEFTFYQPPQPHTRISAITQDHDGAFWLGSWGGGFMRFDPDTGTFETFLHDPDHPGSLSNDNVMSVYVDRAGRIWITTRGGGLNHFDPVNQTFEHFSTNEGMPSSLVFNIAEDRSGRLWITTRDGLVRFDPEQTTIRTFTTSDGLPSNEFEWRALAEDSAGNLLLGTFNGMIGFNPDEAHDNPAVPAVFLTELLLFNEPVPIGGDSPLQQDLSLTSDLVLSYRNSVITFGFAALNYSAPERTRYAYRLVGFEDDWRYVDAERRFATYTNLPPGEYTFQVRAAGSADIWHESGVQLNLQITPPFWQTGWFLGSMGFIVIGTAFAGDRWRNQRSRQAQRELEQRVAERTLALKQAHDQLQIETARRIAAEADQREQFHRILDTVAGVVCIYDLHEQKVDYVNDELTAMIGYTPDAINSFDPPAIAELIHPDDHAPTYIWLQSLTASPPGTTSTHRYRVRTADGKWKHIANRARPFRLEADGSVKQVIMLSSDVTAEQEFEAAQRRLNEELEQRVTERTAELQLANAQLATEMHERQQTQLRLHQMQKMEAIGRLAGGIAHDFNNLLTIILGNTDILLSEMPLDHPWRSDIEPIEQAAQHGADLIRRLLAFSRQQVLEPHILNLNQVITASTPLFQRLIGSGITFHLDLSTEIGSIVFDRTQMEQVLMNLIVNARDAMPDGGDLWIRTTQLDLTVITAAEREIDWNGPAIMLQIEDNGAGMDSATLERIFEPFFSTKAPDKGTGLGLATVHGIVIQSGGLVTVTSTPGRGTCFSIYLPTHPA